MLFEDMQKIWDTQKKQPMYTIDEKTLHNHIEKKAKRINRSAQALEWGLISINLFVILFLAIKMIKAGSVNFNAVILGVVTLVTLYIIGMGRQRKKKSES